MSFADIINSEQKRLEQSQGGNHEKVKYPETKHKRLFFEKGQTELYLQVLPSADLVSQFAVPTRRIFLQAKTSNGKDLKSNFTLDAEPNPGSLLETKIAEWADKGMIPNGFGGQQSPRKLFLVNAVRVVNVNNTYVQERDEHGNLVVRVFEMPQSGYANLLKKLGDPLYNTSGSEFSFMDINKPALVKIAKPGKNQMEYPVDIYTNIILPPLGLGWESQLEDLNAQAVPTERLENGYQWVEAFVALKEGRKPGATGQAENTVPQADANPYANVQQQPMQNVPMQNVQQQPMQNVQQQQQPMQNVPMQNVPQQQVPMQNVPQQQVPVQPTNTELGEVVSESPDNMNFAAPQQPVQNVQQQQVPQQPAAPTMPTHNVNNNGLMDVDKLLAQELGNEN